MGGRAGKYIKAVLSCLFFDMGDRQGRHAWADLMTIIIALGVYRHAYAPQFPLLSWLEGGQWVGFLATGVAWEATTFDYNLISPLSTSVLSARCRSEKLRWLSKLARNSDVATWRHGVVNTMPSWLLSAKTHGDVKCSCPSTRLALAWLHRRATATRVLSRLPNPMTA